MDKLKQNMPIVQAILVPQGVEYQAVCRGLRHCKHLRPQVVSIPIGSNSVQIFLDRWQQDRINLSQSLSSVLVMGLCGSLKPNYAIGTAALYQQCINVTDINAVPFREQTNLRLHTDPILTSWINAQLSNSTKLVIAVASDRIVHTVQAKRDLAQIYDADVVDMEGFAVLQALQQRGVSVAMLRVVSDDCHHDLPDLNLAIDTTGTLQTIPLAMGMIRQPIASMRLIQGSLKALRVLQSTVAKLFAS